MRTLAVAAALALFTSQAAAQSPSRGELLYTTHCIECHGTQVHWRDRRLARNFAALREQVRKWQAAAGLRWSEQDILEVARHLNDTLYGFARPVAAR